LLMAARALAAETGAIEGRLPNGDGTPRRSLSPRRAYMLMPGISTVTMRSPPSSAITFSQTS